MLPLQFCSSKNFPLPALVNTMVESMEGQRVEQAAYTHYTNLKNITFEDATRPRVSIHSQNLLLELRTALPSDAQALLRVFSDEENTKYDESAAGLDNLSAIEKLLSTWTNLTDPLTRLNFVVVADENVVGLSGMGYIYSRDDGKRVGDAGVMINPDARRKGYAKEALRITIDYALRTLRLDEVTVEMKEANTAMRALMDQTFSAAPSKRKDLKFGNEYSYAFYRDEWLHCPQKEP